MKRLALCCLLSSALASSSQADDWPRSGGFDVTEIEDGCGATANFVIPGRSDITATVTFDGERPTLSLLSRDWSQFRGEARLSFFFVGPDLVYEGGVGMSAGIYNGVAEVFEPRMLDAFGAATALLVRRDEIVVANLDLQGSAAAVATLKRCTASVLRRNAAQVRREQAFDYIAEDPFAGSSASATGLPVRPPVITNPSWARLPQPEYPAKAMERRLSGSADLSCTVNPNGSVTNCSIVSETPAGVGFGRAALTGARAARLSPGSVDSVADGGTVRFTQRFSLSD